MRPILTAILSILALPQLSAAPIPEVVDFNDQVQPILSATVSVRRSDDPLRYEATTKDGRTATGSIPGTIGPKFAASVVFLDFGLTDSITDKHRQYPTSYVVPIESR